MDTRARIVQLIRQVAGKEIDPRPDESLFESGLLDSFSLPDLVTAIEESFSIQAVDSDLVPRRFDTIERIEAYIRSKTQ
jgi:acyl carrier protein